MKLPRGHEKQRRETLPDAEWMTSQELNAHKYTGKGILLGMEEGRAIGSDDDRHLLTVAGSRAGKSSTCLLPNLKRWPSSVLCIDPKGELAAATAQTRAAMGQDVFILDPFGEVKGEAARFRVDFDPLSEIRAGEPRDAVDNAMLIADALIVPSKGDTSDHWSLSAKNLIRGLILYGLAVEKTAGINANLNTLREAVTAPLGEDGKTPDGQRIWLSTIFRLMSGSDAFGGTVAGVGGTMQGKPSGERGSIISTAVEQTSFLDAEAMQEHLANSGLPSLRVLKRRPTTIYLVLPASRMATHFRWLRIIITLALACLEREPMRLDAPVLFILEEFPQLGYMRQIEAAAGLMAGYGVKLWTVLQDLPQIKALYRDSWETFIGNAGVIQAFGNTDATTLDYLSKAFGTRTVREAQPTSPTPSSISGGGKFTQEAAKASPLLAPFEVALYGARDSGKQYIKFAGKPPAYIDRLTHEQVASL